MKKIVISIIRLYQKTFSPDHGVLSGGRQHTCRFYPTCSQYAIDSIEKYGIIQGAGKGIWRVLRCNPWNKGGFDPAEPVDKEEYFKTRETHV